MDTHSPAAGPLFSPYDTLRGKARYIACYADAWRGALIRAADSPEALTELRLGGRFAGVLALDDRRGKYRALGWIAFCYVAPELRGQGLGRAMIDFAADHFRRCGRRAMRLTVAPANPAVFFYEKLGFVRVGTEPGALEDLYVMELPL